MPHWLIKAGIHRVISWLPNSTAWNELFQQYVTRSIVLTTQQFQAKLEESQRYFELMRRHAPAGETGFITLEVGTGWYPTIPISLYLCGAAATWTFDIDSHLCRQRLTHLLDFFIAHDKANLLTQHLPGAMKNRLANLEKLRPLADQETPAAWLKRLDIHCAVRDARHTGLQAGAIDFIFSSGVLEYIPPVILKELLQEFHRVAAPAAVMVHRLNLVDQFAYFDKSLSPFNHLKYTERQWRWRSSPLIWQNRIRLSDYRRLLKETGFTIKSEDNTFGTKAELERVKLSPEFQHYSLEDLLVLHSLLVAVRAAPPASAA